MHEARTQKIQAEEDHLYRINNEKLRNIEKLRTKVTDNTYSGYYVNQM